MFDVVLVQSAGVSPWVSVGVGILAIVVGVLTNIWASDRNATKFQASIEATVKTKFEEIEKDISRLEKVDDEQWTAINQGKRELGKVREDIATLKGKQEGFVRAAAPGKEN